MRWTIVIWLLLAFWEHVSAQTDSLCSSRLAPFVKVGYTAGFMAGGDAIKNGSNKGLHFEIGTQIPLSQRNNDEFLVVSSLRYIEKGDRWVHEMGTISICSKYLEIPLRFVYHVPFENHKGYLLMGGGPYVGYALSGSISSNDRLYIYNGYRLQDSLDLFGSEIRAPRWDCGINLMIGWQFWHFLISTDVDFGFVNVLPKRITYNRNSTNIDLSFSLGFIF